MKTSLNPLSEPFTLMRGVRQRGSTCNVVTITVGNILANFIDADRRIKGKGDHEIKIVIFADNIRVVLKLYEDLFRSNRKFSKSQALWAGTIEHKNRIDQPAQREFSNVSIKKLGS